MTNSEKQRLKLDTERAIEVFKLASEWEKHDYDSRFGPLTYKTALAWPVGSPLMAGTCVAAMVIHIQTCRRLGCKPTMEGFACVLGAAQDMHQHLADHDGEENE